MTTAIEVTAAIKANVEEMLADRRTMADFNAQAIALWDEAEAAGVADEVRRIWREENPVIKGL